MSDKTYYVYETEDGGGDSWLWATENEAWDGYCDDMDQCYGNAPTNEKFAYGGSIQRHEWTIEQVISATSDWDDEAVASFLKKLEEV